MSTLAEQLQTIVTSLLANQTRLDIHLNGDETADYTASGGELVPSVQKMIADFESRTEYTGAYAGGGTVYTRGQTFNEVARAYVVTADFTSTTFAADSANYKVSFDITDILASYTATLEAVSNVATGTLLGRTTAGSGDSEELSPADVRTLLSVQENADVTATDNVRAAGALMDDELSSIVNVKAIDQSVASGAAPNFSMANFTLDTTALVVAAQPNFQDFAEEIDHLVNNARGTGVTTTFTGSATAGGTTFTLSAVGTEVKSDQGFFHNDFAGATATIGNLYVANTYVYIDNAGTLSQQTTYPTPLDWVRKVFVMRIAVDIAPGANVVVGFEYFCNPIGNESNHARTLYRYMVAAGIPLKENMEVTGRASDLGFDVAAGTMMEYGGTGDIFNPHDVPFDLVENAEFFLVTKTAFDAGGNTALPLTWDNNGVNTIIASTALTAHRLYRFSNGNFCVQYGQFAYANMLLAKAGIASEEYVLNPILKNATFLGWWLLEDTATNTSGTTKTAFVEYTVGIQGGVSSGLTGAMLRGNNGDDIPDPVAFKTSLGLQNLDNTSDAVKITATTAAVDASIGLRRSNQKNAIYTNGAQAALITENKARVDLDTLGFCLVLPHMELLDWAPAVAVTLLDKSDSNLGVKLTLETDGSLKLAMGNGTNFTTLTYSSTALITNNDAQTVQITINCERADSVYFYVNGSQLGAGVDCTDSTSQNLTNSGNWEILTDGAGWVSGYFGVHLGVRDVADIYADYFRPERLQLAKVNQTALISDTETFGATIGSSRWGKFSHFEHSFNNDGVSDGSESRDNCYKYMPSSNSVSKRFYRGSDGVSYAGNQGQTFRIRYGYYIPTASPNISNLRLLLNQTGLDNDSFGGNSATSGIKGTWTDVELVGEMAVGTTGQLYWYLNSAASFSGDEVDDIVYFSNWSIDVLGWGIVVDISAGEWCKPDLSETGTDKEEALPFNTYAPSGAESTTLNNEFWQSFTLEWAASSTAQNVRASTTELFSASDQIEIWAKSTSGEHFIIGDEADSDRYFAEAVIGTSWVRLSLANTATDGTNLELIAQPLDGSASPESRTDALQLRIKTTRLDLRK